LHALGSSGSARRKALGMRQPGIGMTSAVMDVQGHHAHPLLRQCAATSSSTVESSPPL
jgi:hypothetical protein